MGDAPNTTTPPHTAEARACANIALVKYWGKLDSPERLAAVPSLSMTLNALETTTRVSFLKAEPSAGASDAVTLNGRTASDSERARVTELLDAVRERAGLALAARVDSDNNFPTAAGLASSASGFAALALAGLVAAGLKPDLDLASELARGASVSAGRSLHGGFVALDAGARRAEPLTAPGSDLRMAIAITRRGPKKVGSSAGMKLTEATSPFHSAWVSAAPSLYQAARQALARGEWAELGRVMEHSTLLMHATMMAADPGLIYMSPASLAVIERVRQLRESGRLAFFTLDAGPHVKVLTQQSELAEVSSALQAVPGVLEVLESGLGGAAQARVL